MEKKRNMKKKNKRGFLLANETLKIIIAVICISFLVYFLSMLYLSKTGTQKRADAEKNLERIEEIIGSLNVGESERQGIGNPNGWHIYSFLDSEKPNSCAGESCLCICGKALDINGQFNRQIKKCDSEGVCLGIRGLQSRDLDIKIMGENSFVFLNIKKTNQGIFIEQIR
jgi:hypothetical protein